MRALDLFCGGGGAARGILAAGFDEIVGIDIKDHRKSYPGHFIQGDALNPPVRLEDFDFVWASPPCQTFSRHVAGHRKGKAPKLVAETQALLAGHPWTTIENVVGAPIRADVVLTGPMVGLHRLGRRRHFDLSFLMLSPSLQQPMGRCTDGTLVTVSKSGGIGSRTRPARRRNGLSLRFSATEMATAMGLAHSGMTMAEVGEAVPPAYAEFIAREALRQMQ